MTLKIKTPPMPKPAHRGPTGTGTYFDAFTPDQLAARDAQWIELVGPVVEAADRLLKSLAPHSLEAKTVVEVATRLMNAKADTRAALRAITEEQE